MRLGASAVVAAGLLAVGGGSVGLILASQSGYTSPRVAPAVRLPVPLGTVLGTPSPAVVKPVPGPAELTIPAIGVRTSLIRLGLTKTGALQVPPTAAIAGWYTGSPAPGAVGSAVIAGHVDSYAGPGVFYRLRELRPGDRIYVKQQGGTLAVFSVSSVDLYRKSQFPTSRVYGPTPTPELRLITCGGTFDPQLGSYLSNVVVYSVLSG
ncbi:MAG TPA: class F sortase [Streptosporangiaceae bacterium]